MTPAQKAERANKQEAEKKLDEIKALQKKAAQDAKNKEFTLIGIGKNAVRSRLKDPKSAEFKNIYVFVGKNNVPVICGQVNSKNSFGAYVGFQRFVTAGSSELTFLQSDADDFDSVWNKFCKK